MARPKKEKKLETGAELNPLAATPLLQGGYSRFNYSGFIDDGVIAGVGPAVGGNTYEDNSRNPLRGGQQDAGEYADVYLTEGNPFRYGGGATRVDATEDYDAELTAITNNNNNINPYTQGDRIGIISSAFFLARTGRQIVTASGILDAAGMALNYILPVAPTPTPIQGTELPEPLTMEPTKPFTGEMSRPSAPINLPKEIPGTDKVSQSGIQTRRMTQRILYNPDLQGDVSKKKSK